MKAFTIWTEMALAPITLARSTEYGLTFGIAHFGEVWFRFFSRHLYCHISTGQTVTDAKATMERRNS